jgi:hypothetical protein
MHRRAFIRQAGVGLLGVGRAAAWMAGERPNIVLI